MVLVWLQKSHCLALPLLGLLLPLTKSSSSMAVAASSVTAAWLGRSSNGGGSVRWNRNAIIRCQTTVLAMRTATRGPIRTNSNSHRNTCRIYSCLSRPFEGGTAVAATISTRETNNNRQQPHHSRLFATQQPPTTQNNSAHYKDLEAVAQQIAYHDSLYYTPGKTPEINDDEYDALVEREKDLCQDFPDLLQKYQDESGWGEQSTRFGGRVGPLLTETGDDNNNNAAANLNNATTSKDTAVKVPPSATANADRVKRKHLTKMLSLDNVTTEEELVKWIERICKRLLQHSKDENTHNDCHDDDISPILELQLLTEPKLDGLSLSLRYERTPSHGNEHPTNSYKLQWAATRGDGTQGHDVTPALMDMTTVPTEFTWDFAGQEMSPPFILEVRGEVVLPTSIFEDQLQRTTTFSNARNAASGILLRSKERTIESSQQTTKELRSYLRFYAYDMVMVDDAGNTFEDEPIPNHVEARSMLGSAGFNVPEPFLVTTVHLSNISNSSSGDDDGKDDVNNDKAAEWELTHAVQPLLGYYNSLIQHRLEKSGSGDTNHAAMNKNGKKNQNNYEWGDYDMDGAVQKVSEKNLRQILGSNTRAPRWSIAHKFPQTSVVTSLEGIDIQVGRTGALTPVAILKPVNVGGVTIQRATLHNFCHAQNLLGGRSIPKNCSVMVRRAGEVIPQVVKRVPDNSGDENSNKASTSSWISLEAPSKCPACGAGTTFDVITKKASATSDDDNNTEVVDIDSVSYGEVLRCAGSPLQCPPRAVSALAHAFSRDALNISGLSEARIQQLLEAKLITVPSDLFRLLDEQNEGSEVSKLGKKMCDLPKWGNKSVQNLVNKAQHVATNGISLQQFIYSLGIRHVGRNNSKLISSAYTSIHNFLMAMEEASKAHDQNFTFSILSTKGVKNFGPVALLSLRSFCQEAELVQAARDLARAIPIHDDDTPVEIRASNRGKISQISENKDEEVKAKLPLYNMRVVFTGSLPSMKRSEAQELAKRLGAKSTPASISKSTSLLVAGEKVGSMKLKKAVDLGVRVIDPIDFLEMVEEYEKRE